MRLLLTCVGKVREPYLREAVDDYLRRLRRYVPVEVAESRDAAAALRRIPDRYLRCILDEGGQELTSEELRQLVEREMTHGRAGIAFLVGGADGLPPEVQAEAEVRLSLSRLTLPHRLARLVLAEQLYRVLCMIRGVPYHRA